MRAEVTGEVTGVASCEAIVVGGGLVGLSCALALGERGVQVVVISEHRRGEASPAAAGMLAPSVERSHGLAAHFAYAARDRYATFVAALADATGEQISLSTSGILELALSPEAGDAMRQTAPSGAQWLDAQAVAAAEPALRRVAGALLHPRDGAVDNVALFRALERRVADHPRATLVREAVASVVPDAARPVVVTAAGTRREAAVVVVAAGAWVGQGLIGGLPCALPVTPVRGQMVSFDAAPLTHVVYAPEGYLVPRGSRTVAGSTMERVGFEVGTTPAAVAGIVRMAGTICPSLAGALVADTWSGLRPVTPDLQPIIGPDPQYGGLLYACGHSRNGILLAPLTGECIAALATGEESEWDLAPFRVERFG